MSETVQHESKTKVDLSGLLGSVPPTVIEMLGEENVAVIESRLALTERFTSVMRAPNPFEAQKPAEVRLIDVDTRQAMESVDEVSAESVHDSDETAIRAFRDNAPIIRDCVKKHVDYIVENHGASLDRRVEIADGIQTLQGAPESVLAAELPNLHKELADLAAGLIPEGLLKDLSDLLKLESVAHSSDAEAVGYQHDERLREMVKQAWEESTRARRRNSPTYEALFQKYVDLSFQAAEKGQRRSLRTRRVHRKYSEIYHDKELAISMPDRLDTFRERGGRLHQAIVDMAADAAHGSSVNLFQIIAAVNNGFRAQHTADFLSTAPDELKTAAIETEAYLVQKARTAESLMGVSKVKLTREGRVMLGNLKERQIAKTVREMASLAIEPTNPYESEAVDTKFRAMCREARNVLAGGGRLNHQEARTLASELHRLRFGKNGNGYELEPAESGIVIAAMAKQLDSLVATVERFEASNEAADPQVGKLRFEAPDQYKAISGFDLDSAIRRLKSILDDPDDSRTLLGSLPSSEDTVCVREAIEDIWRHRLGEDGTERIEVLAGAELEDEAAA